MKNFIYCKFCGKERRFFPSKRGKFCSTLCTNKYKKMINDLGEAVYSAFLDHRRKK